MLRKNRFVRCYKQLEDDAQGGGLPLVGSTTCCNMSRKQEIVAGTCVGLALPIFQQSLACQLGGRPLLFAKPGLLVDAILGRRIADVDEAYVSMDTRADIVVEKVLEGPRTAGDCDEEPPVMVRRRGWKVGLASSLCSYVASRG
jgi:hypothetical protein